MQQPPSSSHSTSKKFPSSLLPFQSQNPSLPPPIRFSQKENPDFGNNASTHKSTNTNTNTNTTTTTTHTTPHHLSTNHYPTSLLKTIPSTPSRTNSAGKKRVLSTHHGLTHRLSSAHSKYLLIEDINGTHTTTTPQTSSSRRTLFQPTHHSSSSSSSSGSTTTTPTPRMSTVLPTSSPSFIKSKKYPTSTSIPSAVTPTSTPTTTTPITATSSSMTTTSTLRQPPFPSYTSKSGVKETFVTPSSSKPTPNGLPTSSRYGRSRDRRTQNKGSSLLSSTIHTLVLDPGRHQHQSQGQVKEKEVKDEIEYAPILKGQSLQDEPVFPTLLHIPDVTIDQVRPSLEDLIFSRPSNTHFDPFFINPPEDPLSSTDFHVDLEFLQPPPQPSSMPHRLVPTVSDPCPPPNKKDEDEDDGKRKVTSVLPNRAPETENEDQVVVEIEKKEDDEEPLPMFLFATEPDTTPSPPPLDGTPPLPPTTVCPSSPVLTEHGTPILRRRPRPPPPSRPSNISPLPTWTPSGPQKDNARQDETQVLDRTPSCSPLAKSHPLLPVHAEQPDPAPPTDEPETNGKDHHGNPPLFGPQGPSPSSSLRWNHLVNKPHGVPCDDTLNEQKRRGTKEDEEET